MTPPPCEFRLQECRRRAVQSLKRPGDGRGGDARNLDGVSVWGGHMAEEGVVFVSGDNYLHHCSLQVSEEHRLLCLPSLHPLLPHPSCWTLPPPHQPPAARRPPPASTSTTPTAKANRNRSSFTIFTLWVLLRADIRNSTHPDILF